MNFLNKHLIEKIYEQIVEKQSVLKHTHFFYFDEPVDTSRGKLDRVNRWNPFIKDEVLPHTFYAMNGNQLLDVYKRLKQNDFYIYKSIDGKSHKLRIKKGERNNNRR